MVFVGEAQTVMPPGGKNKKNDDTHALHYTYQWILTLV